MKVKWVNTGKGTQGNAPHIVSAIQMVANVILRPQLARVVFMHCFLPLVGDPTALGLPTTKAYSLTHHLQLGKQHGSIFQF